jgi:hypothetical protein
MTTQILKIRFLDEMNRKSGLFSELAAFLIAEKIATALEVHEILAKPGDFRAAEFYVLMRRCESTMQMVDWEWALLPVEVMKLIIVTHNGVKEFAWTS